MRINLIITIGFLLFLLNKSVAQIAYPRLITLLPALINEASGIEFNGYNSLWIHNDSGDKPRIYKTDTLGNLLRTFSFENTQAIDFEDMTQDEKGNFYVGDFGNNYSDRTNLHILKFKNPDSVLLDSIIPEVISFSYSDQFAYPPAADKMNFDCEALIHHNDSLLIFSKNHGLSKYVRVYKLPDVAGNYIVSPVDSFYTDQWVTGADISPDKKTLVLLSDSVLWIFRNFSSKSFFDGTCTKLKLPNTQKEGVVFVNDHAIFIVDEKEALSLDGQKLYILDLAMWLGVNENLMRGSYSIFPNPSAGGDATLKLDLVNNENIEIRVLNLLGETISVNNVDMKRGSNDFKLAILSDGIYLVQITYRSGSSTLKYFVKR